MLESSNGVNDIEFAQKMSPFLGKPFSLGDRSKGWDCLNSMKAFFESVRMKFPDEFKGWTWGNYAERWKKEMNFTIFKEFLFSLGEPVERNFILPGDIIIFEKAGYVSAGIYLGSGNFQAVSNPHGVVRMPLRFFETAITGVRRLKK